MNIFLDVETLPCQIEGYRDSIEVSPPGNYKKPETIAAWFENEGETKRDEIYRASSLDGTYGEIFCIGVMAEGLEGRVICSPKGERDTLQTFVSYVYGLLGDQSNRRRPFFIGHNVSFDLKFLWKRCIIRGVPMPFEIPHNAKPWAGKYFCTMHEWDADKRISQANLCKVLGIEHEDDIDGSQVWDAYQAGRYEDIQTHCMADILRVRDIYERLTQ